MGPGYGEAVVVHLGEGEWLVVDSCVDAGDPQKPVAPLRYLRQIGVPVEHAVKFIVISHWDDDHARGIGEVVQACQQARFVCSHVFPADKFANFVEALSIGSAATDGANVRDIRNVLEILDARRTTIYKAAPGRKLHPNPVIQTWSPCDFEATEFLRYIANMHPKAGEPLRKATPGTGNLTSVVLTIDWPEFSVLLGADMENSADNRRGWGAVVSEAERVGYAKSDLVKIPHHGSHTGHDARMWHVLLHPNPVSVVAPFGRGPSASRPPKPSDVRRIAEMSRAMFLTAGRVEPKIPEMDVAVRRSLREGMITLTSQKSSLGIVRLRRLPGGPWTHELFGAAIRVK
jgi:hypothetical protein